MENLSHWCTYKVNYAEPENDSFSCHAFFAEWERAGVTDNWIPLLDGFVALLVKASSLGVILTSHQAMYKREEK